jgi:hypothetical protein
VLVSVVGHMASQMTLEIHSLVKNADYFDVLLKHSIKDHMRTDREFTIAGSNLIASSSSSWISSDLFDAMLEYPM